MSLSLKKLFALLLFLYSNLLFSQVTIHQENFNTGIGTWSAVNVNDATDVWSPVSGYMQINGIGGSNDEDWLVSPSINMDAQTDEFFLFDYNDVNPGNLIELFYSTNYNNGGTAADVALATWTNIPLKVIDMNATTCMTTIFQRHPAIDIGAITGTSVYFAFKYTGTTATARQYQIDNVHIDASYFANLTPGINCAALKDELHSLIATQTDRISYTSSTQYDVWDAILHTDTRTNDAGTATIVWDMFTDFPTTTGEFEFDHCANRDQGSCPGGEGNCYNREHTFPKSWWGGGTSSSDSIYTDMHHIYASDRALNTSKSNYPPGNVITPVTTGTNGVMFGANGTYPCTPTTGSKKYFEPIDEYKGDYARTFFYVVTRYQHRMNSWKPLNSQGNCFMDGTAYPSIQNWALQTLLQWHAADPVSQKEIDHNKAVYAIQGNWNPFIFEPNFVFLIWGDATGTPCSFTALPVELASFNARQEQGSVMLDWTTTTENNNDYFLVERSSDLINWTEISYQEGAGNSTTKNLYSTIDYSPIFGKSYYRLKQVDFNGSYSYSEIREVEFGGNGSFVYYPNPVINELSIKGKTEELGEIRIYDLIGRDVTTIVTFDFSTREEVKINMSALSADVYIIETNSGQQRVIKNE